MNSLLEISQILLSIALLPVAVYIVRLERRLVRMEMKIDEICRTLERGRLKKE